MHLNSSSRPQNHSIPSAPSPSNGNPFAASLPPSNLCLHELLLRKNVQLQHLAHQRSAGSFISSPSSSYGVDGNAPQRHTEGLLVNNKLGIIANTDDDRASFATIMRYLDSYEAEEDVGLDDEWDLNSYLTSDRTMLHPTPECSFQWSWAPEVEQLLSPTASTALAQLGTDVVGFHGLVQQQQVIAAENAGYSLVNLSSIMCNNESITSMSSAGGWLLHSQRISHSPMGALQDPLVNASRHQHKRPRCKNQPSEQRISVKRARNGHNLGSKSNISMKSTAGLEPDGRHIMDERTKPSASPQAKVTSRVNGRRSTATDPQSIAARMRRERFSDQIRVLQRLVPNGERLNTVSMLGKTLEYIRFLQHQVWELYHGSDGRSSGSIGSLASSENWKDFIEAHKAALIYASNPAVSAVTIPIA